jgi:dTDP-4-amino-4,6-dideoxygalactose transaminase
MLEQQFSDRLGVPYTIAVSSGTAALSVALAALGVASGDEVICPAYDWPSGVAAIRSLGAKPVFADIDPSSLTIDPASAVNCISGRSRAVLATHCFGIPADIPRLRMHLEPFDIPVVEDCAQALGASIDGQPVGSMGTAAAFSLGPGKPVDAGEGGLVVFQEEHHFRSAIRVGQHPVRQLLAGIESIHFGSLNHRIHPVAALLAKEIHEWINGVPGLKVLGVDSRRKPNWYRVPIQSDLNEVPEIPLLFDSPGALLLSDGCAPIAVALAPRIHTASLTERREDSK